jgi:hypothetical protein
MPYRIAKYRKTRFFGLYDGEELLAVTVYKKGARELKDRLEAKDRELTQLKGVFQAVIAEDYYQLEEEEKPAPRQRPVPTHQFL